MPGGLGGFGGNLFGGILTVLFAGAGLAMSGLMSLYHLLKGDWSEARWWALLGAGVVVAGILVVMLMGR